jgi:dihydroorotase
MSKFLNMGFSMEQVVAMATINAANAIGKVPKLGTLQAGAPGDVTILEVVNGPVEFVDTRNNKRSGNVHIRPVQTVTGGIAFGRPFSAPFSVR